MSLSRPSDVRLAQGSDANFPITVDAASALGAPQTAITVSRSESSSSEPVSVLTGLLLLNEASTEVQNQRIISAINRASQHFFA